MGGFSFQHVVTFEETNVVGNVYFTNYFLWQGRCRELFLWEHCPKLMERIIGGELAMATLDSSCSFRAELFAGEKVVMDMYLERTTASRMWLSFDYHRLPARELVATGRQVIGCLKVDAKTAAHTACEIPGPLRAAMEKYQRKEEAPQ